MATEKTSNPQTLFEKILPPEARTKKDVLTVLNAITAARFVVGNVLVSRLRDNPADTWKSLAVVLATDKESWLARLAEVPKVGPVFERLGFRRSELGRRLDPVTDKIVGFRVVKASMDNGTLPRWLGVASLVQKSATASVVIAGQTRGINMKVTPVGQVGEFITDLGLIGVSAAESVHDPALRQLARFGALAAVCSGVTLATIATSNLLEQAKNGWNQSQETGPIAQHS